MTQEQGPRSRRALLYIPGSDQGKMAKAVGLHADCICFDLEDGVVPGRKAAARGWVTEALKTLNLGGSERLARINGVGSGLDEQDLASVLPARPDGIVIPKVTDADQVRHVSERIGQAERANGWEPGAIHLLVMIESARAILNLPEIAAADSRLQALIFGAEDWAADVGAIRTREGLEVLAVRSAVVNCAAAFQLQALDLIYTDFRDGQGLAFEAHRGAQLGYVGMQIIHPDQIDVVQTAFTPDQAAIDHAQRVIQAAHENEGEGKGAFGMDGKMVDRPIVKAAERVLARARAAGQIP